MGVSSNAPTNKPVKAIVNAYSTTGFNSVVLGATVLNAMGKYSTSGTCLANTLKTVLSVTGAGQINYLAVATIDNLETQTRTHRIRITLDGVVAFDSTAATTATYYAGFVPVGVHSSLAAVPTPVTFNHSCLVEYASSVTEDDKAGIWMNYQTY